MKGGDKPGRVPEASGERISSLIEAIGRIGTSLDHDTVQAVRNFVKKLRRKLGDDPASPALIINARGVGYSMPGLGEA
ncbi:MAG: winged helix-turn-helix domain-containing protein [Nitrospinae bacterium]|nr:winged helix-turn-helix domain-containing protein [Nitrospinota bacterium]